MTFSLWIEADTSYRPWVFNPDVETIVVIGWAIMLNSSAVLLLTGSIVELLPCKLLSAFVEDGDSWEEPSANKAVRALLDFSLLVTAAKIVDKVLEGRVVARAGLIALERTVPLLVVLAIVVEDAAAMAVEASEVTGIPLLLAIVVVGADVARVEGEVVVLLAVVVVLTLVRLDARLVVLVAGTTSVVFKASSKGLFSVISLGVSTDDASTDYKV